MCRSLDFLVVGYHGTGVVAKNLTSLHQKCGDTTAGENAVNPVRYGMCFNAFTAISSYSVFLVPNWLPSLKLPAHP